MLTLIVARARNGAIGKNNQIPWHIPQDLKMFQRETTGGALIMGRLTWESLPVRPLKNRLNLVVSRNPAIAEHVFADIRTALQFARDQGYHRIYGIGGERIYSDLLPVADRLLISEVDTVIEDADASFPAIDDNDWRELSCTPIPDAQPACHLRELIRR